MTNIYTWVIDSLDCIPSIDGQNNVVSCIHWRVNAVSNQGKILTLINGDKQTIPYIATVYGSEPLIYTAENPFTEYENLTEIIVIGWLQDQLGATKVIEIQNSLDLQIENLANPPVVTPPLPWAE